MWFAHAGHLPKKLIFGIQGKRSQDGRLHEKWTLTL